MSRQQWDYTILVCDEAMQDWKPVEFRGFERARPVGNDDLTGCIQNLGRDGWELVGIVGNDEIDGKSRREFIFKRSAGG